MSTVLVAAKRSWACALVFAACLGFAGVLFAETKVPQALVSEAFTGLAAKELGDLSEGKAVIRTGSNPRVLAIAASNGTAGEIRDRFAKLGPNYFAEFLYVAPFSAAYLDALQALLADPKNFVGMSYYSKRNGKTYSLFDRVDVLVREVMTGGGIAVHVRQHMEPFDEYRAVYSSRRVDKTLFFSLENEDPIVYTYQKFGAVRSGDMAWMLYAYESKGYLVFYGAGGVKAFDLLGAFRSRLETSFMGRIEAFFSFAMKTQAKSIR
jgi:hypothetical protein